MLEWLSSFDMSGKATQEHSPGSHVIVGIAGPPPNTVNALGEPIYDPLKDIELATQKVGFMAFLNGLEIHKPSGLPSNILDSYWLCMQATEVAATAARNVSTRVCPPYSVSR